MAIMVLVHLSPLLKKAHVARTPPLSLSLSVWSPAPVRFDEIPHQADALAGPHVPRDVGWPGILQSLTSEVRVLQVLQVPRRRPKSSLWPGLL